MHTAGTGRKNIIKKQHAVIDSRRASEPTTEGENAQQQSRVKTQKDVTLITRAFSKNFIFNNLTQENRQVVINSMQYFTIEAGKTLFEQGQPGRYFFVVVTGKLQVIVNEQDIAMIASGQSLGELALLHDTPRSATLVALENVTLWGLERKQFRQAVESVNANDYQENRTFINGVPTLSVLSDQQKDQLISAFISHQYTDGSRIFSQGDSGDFFFLIKEGTVSVTQEGVECRQLGRGDFFGEMALLYDGLRTATVTAMGQVRWVSIGRDILNELLGTELQQVIYRNSQRIAIDENEKLCKLNKEQAESLIDAMKITRYDAGQVVIPSNYPLGTSMWIVVKGSVKGRSQSTPLFTSFQIIGEDLIIQSNATGQFAEDIVAEEETEVATVDKATFDAIIGEDFEEVTAFNEAASVLRQVQLLSGMDQENFVQLVKAMEVKNYSDQDLIVQETSAADQFFIVKSGKVEVLKEGQTVRTVTKNDYFGERALIFNDFRSASVMASGDVSCWVLEKSQFLHIIDSKIRNQLLFRIDLQDESIQLAELQIGKWVGQGMFGNVYLAWNSQKPNVYALKTMTRKTIAKHKIQRNVQQERSILMQLDHTMILKLVKTFKDDKRVYLLTEYVRGMDLFDVLRQMDLLNENQAKFYISWLLQIFEYLHDREIVYRDLKPENIMIDEMGYPKLVDFGTSKVINSRTYTIVGTPHYMAPEVINGQGYGVMVDLWSMGVWLYELISGDVPFGAEEDEPYAIYERVLEHKLRYPSFMDSNFPTKAIIENLLDTNPKTRGYGNIKYLKQHPWFKAIDQKQLITREFVAPYVPPLKNLENEIKKAKENTTPIEDMFLQNENDDSISSIPSTNQSDNSDWDLDF